MPEILEPRTKDILRAYVRDVKGANNEAAKRSRFTSVIAELFPGTNAVSEFSRGIEKLIRIDQASGQKRGRADAYYGNAIIEFEKSLSATLERGEASALRVRRRDVAEGKEGVTASTAGDSD